MNKLSSDILRNVTSQINNKTLKLVSLPDAILKVNKILDDNDSDIREIARVIQGDIALSLRLIQIANSPGLRVSKEINSIYDAIMILGLNMVRNLAVCVSLKDGFTTDNIAHKHLMEQKIHTSIHRSIYSYLISEHIIRLKSPEISLVAGLVGNIGDIVILRYIGEHPEYSKLDDNEVNEIITDIGQTVSISILVLWDFPIDILKAAFGSTVWNQEYLGNYHDSYMVADGYIKYRSGKNESSVMFTKVDEMLYANTVELKSLESIFG